MLGVKSNFRGGAARVFEIGYQKLIREAVASGIIFIPLCPEQLGGLPTPRKPSELIDPAAEIFAGNGKVLDNSGHDVTDNFIRGAQETLAVARLLEVKLAVLKERSPSCGSTEVYSGDFSGTAVPGEGLTAHLLRINGIRVLNENDFSELLKQSPESLIR